MRGLPLHLKSYLRDRGEWVAKNALCRLEIRTKKGGLYGADIISRTLRNLEEKSIVAVKYIDNHSHYKYIPEPIRKGYIPTSERDKEAILFKQINYGYG